MQILQRLFKYQLIISLCSPSVLTHLSHTKVYKNLVLKPEVFAPPIQRLIDDRCEANQFFYTFLLKRENSWFKFRRKYQNKNKRRPLVGTVRRLGENALSTTEDCTPIITWSWTVVGTCGT